jgi:hypothetical protein
LQVFKKFREVIVVSAVTTAIIKRIIDRPHSHHYFLGAFKLIGCVRSRLLTIHGVRPRKYLVDQNSLVLSWISPNSRLPLQSSHFFRDKAIGPRSSIFHGPLGGVSGKQPAPRPCVSG